MADETAALRKQVIDLERKLAQAHADRDDLARDVEALCMETTANTTFSSSSVLRERIFAAEKEVSATKAELREATAERDSLREDLREVREAKRVADQSFREQTARTEALERELSFYRQQAAHAIADRDSTAWECEQLRERNAELTSKAQDADRRAEAATVERATAERRLKEAESVIAGLRDAAAQAEAIPGLRADLRRATTRCEELQQSLSGLEKELQKERRASEAAEAAAESAASDALARAEEFAAAQRAEAEAVQALQSELAEVTRQKVDALMRLSDAEMVRSRADGEVVRLREKLAAAEEQLVQATAEKVQALMRVADADSIARTEGHDGGITPGKGTPHASPKKPAAKTPERRSWFGGASTAVPSEG